MKKQYFYAFVLSCCIASDIFSAEISDTEDRIGKSATSAIISFLDETNPTVLTPQILTRLEQIPTNDKNMNVANALNLLEAEIQKEIFLGNKPGWAVGNIRSVVYAPKRYNPFGNNNVQDEIENTFCHLVSKIDESTEENRKIKNALKALGDTYYNVRGVMDAAWNMQDIRSFVSEESIEKVKKNYLQTDTLNHVLDNLRRRALCALERSIIKTGGDPKMYELK